MCHEISDVVFFSWIRSFLGPDYRVFVFSNFLKNSPRYLRFSMLQRSQRHQCSSFSGISDIGVVCLSGVSNTAVVILQRCRWHRYSYTTAVLLTPVRQCWHWCSILQRCQWHRCSMLYRCRRHRYSTENRKYLGEFFKKFENTKTIKSGPSKDLIHEKEIMSKISWHTPFKGTVSPHENGLRVQWAERPCLVHEPPDVQ